MAEVAFDQASRSFPGSDIPAVDQLDLEIIDGEFLVLVGPSGCGKSTTLRMLSGLEGVDSGRIRIGDRDVTDIPPQRRDIAMVFQNYALYPHMTVGRNMGFALSIAGVAKDEIRRRVTEAARLLDLEPYLDRKPKALSGGQRQRVAMGRAIVREPQVFCLDEPLSNLDAKLRMSTRSEIAALQRRLGTTTMFVTHDQVEAMTMGDRVAVLDQGVLQQCAPPRELYETPANVFVAGFIGSPPMNLYTVPVDGDRARLGTGSLPMPQAANARPVDTGGQTTLGFRAEAVRLVGETPETIPARVDLVEVLGSEALCHASILDDDTVTDHGRGVVARMQPRHAPARGEKVHLEISRETVHCFSPETGRRVT